uniref:Uncharacterized protein n=1 Tax=Parastrongyloides trichosuri TaxID=131310 RepID=A0A0N4ZWC6_PARTI
MLYNTFGQINDTAQLLLKKTDIVNYGNSLSSSPNIYLYALIFAIVFMSSIVFCVIICLIKLLPGLLIRIIGSRTREVTGTTGKSFHVKGSIFRNVKTNRKVFKRSGCLEERKNKYYKESLEDGVLSEEEVFLPESHRQGTIPKICVTSSNSFENIVTNNEKCQINNCRASLDSVDNDKKKIIRGRLNLFLKN